MCNNFCTIFYQECFLLIYLFKMKFVHKVHKVNDKKRMKNKNKTIMNANANVCQQQSTYNQCALDFIRSQECTK